MENTQKKTQRDYVREWRIKNAERNKENQKRWNAENKDKCREYRNCWNKKNKEKHYFMIKENLRNKPEQWAAQHLINHAVQRGKIIKPMSCSICGNAEKPNNIHAHHEDYSKPLEIIWVCRKCHNFLHSREGINSDG